jgi:23S rRNA (adenine2503-C2)-methyltransferase
LTTSPFSIHDEIRIKELLIANGHKPFRYAQIENAIYKNFITDFSLIETLPKDIREILNQNCYFTSLRVHSETTSADGQTTKFLFKTHDDKMIEAVIMRHLSGRNTLCVSSQAGCPMACVFCATGKLGLIRNLTFSEIVEQVMHAASVLNTEGKRLRNIVYMGMGEPFLNYENLKRSIQVVGTQKKLDISMRRITVSTCGIIPGINQLAEDFPQVSLAVSLHAPNDVARGRIMPVENTYPIDKLMECLDQYVAKTNKRVFYEYIMISGITDRVEYARELAELLKDRMAHVNFIPYNPGEGIMGEGMLPTSKLLIAKFQKELEKAGVPSTVRHTMGDDIDAACGQLALKENGESLATEQGRSIWKGER